MIRNSMVDLLVVRLIILHYTTHYKARNYITRTVGKEPEGGGRGLQAFVQTQGKPQSGQVVIQAG
jgi:hypothetical protein